MSRFMSKDIRKWFEEHHSFHTVQSSQVPYNCCQCQQYRKDAKCCGWMYDLGANYTDAYVDGNTVCGLYTHTSRPYRYDMFASSPRNFKLERIETIVTFEAAHRLVNYDGPCNDLHGHSYKAIIGVCAERGLCGDDPSMIMDFKKLKTCLRGITDKFDHRLIMWKDDPWRAGLIRMGVISLLDVDYPVTAENMANDILERLKFNLSEMKLTDKRIYRIEVKLYETENNSVTITWVNNKTVGGVCNG
ncbi:MAG: hypothetical protein Pg6A_19620 [Termitinemataceae bacterium]|nr:MAG: hypothetical protein Pg6A_19620 [Termitinemataceae bacterium]